MLTAAAICEWTTLPRPPDLSKWIPPKCLLKANKLQYRGEFWEMKSTLLKSAEVGKCCAKGSFARLQDGARK